MELKDEIENKENFYKRTKNKKYKTKKIKIFEEMKLKYQKQRGLNCFLGERKEKKFVDDKPSHLHRYAPQQKENDTLLFLMT